MPTKYSDVNGHAIYYHYRGATTLPEAIPDFSRGRKIVFVHGEGGNGAPWHNQVDALAGRHSPVAFDFPGHGRSDGVEGLQSIREYADFVAGFMDALKFQSAVIAGWSMGGAVAMEFALHYPARVEALILIATAAKFAIPQDRVEQLRAVMMGRAPQTFVTEGFSSNTVKENFNVVREMWMEQVKTDPRVRYTDTRACQEVDLTGAISAIKKPTLILCGEAGTATMKDAELIKDQIQGARLEEVPDAGNMIPVEQPVVVNDAIEEFLGGLK
jgi:pimeloyl-ACP methyl ester carboxylesterase